MEKRKERAKVVKRSHYLENHNKILHLYGALECSQGAFTYITLSNINL